jgi:hypothetical protein
MESNALFKMTKLLSHEFLGHVMPFASGWCDDGEGKPVPWSVTLANLLQVAQFPHGTPGPKAYLN